MGLYTLSYMWYTATAVATVVIVGLIVSFITGKRNGVGVSLHIIHLSVSNIHLNNTVAKCFGITIMQVLLDSF